MMIINLYSKRYTGMSDILQYKKGMSDMIGIQMNLYFAPIVNLKVGL